LAGCSQDASGGNTDGGGKPSRGVPTPVDPNKNYATSAQVIDAVKAAQGITALPDSLAASLTKEDQAGAQGFFDCRAVDNPSNAALFGDCAYGDQNGEKLMVIVGDSRSSMWATALEGVAAKNGWQLRVFMLRGCAVPDLQIIDTKTGSPYQDCDTFHTAAPKAINELHPDLVLATSGAGNAELVNGGHPSAEQWQSAWVASMNKYGQSGAKLAVIGSIPTWAGNYSRCLAAHLNDVQKCSVPVAEALPPNLDAERAAAGQVGAVYVDTTPWVCAERCEPVIADMRVFNDQYHFTRTYVSHLTGALNEALQPALAR
jgi:hypothetical protein